MERRTHPLRHPLWWAALALLVLNDHLLKSAFGGALTGKLSDFAGLIVAPVLLAVLLRRRALAFALVGGWFVAVKLVPAAAEANEQLAALLGLRWRIVADPSDLVALAVLPLAWMLASDDRSPRRAIEHTAVAIGVAASVASPMTFTWRAQAYLTNRTGDRIEIRVRHLDASLSCEHLAGRIPEAFARDAFGPGMVFELDENETLPLDRDVFDAAGIFTAPANLRDCDAAMLSAEGLPDTIVFWEGLPGVTVRPQLDDDHHQDVIEAGVQITGRRTRTLVAPDAYTIAAPIDAYEGDAACRDYGAPTSFEWSSIPRGPRVELSAVDEGADRCLRLAFADDRIGYLCIPRADFPFEAGHVLSIDETEDTLTIARTLEPTPGERWPVAELVVRRRAASWAGGPFVLTVAPSEPSCIGQRLACGAFRVPGAAVLAVGPAERWIHPGETIERTHVDGRRARLRLGRAETLAVARESCGSDGAIAGPWIDALIVFGERPR